MSEPWKSESIDKLAPALLAAQKAMGPAIKDCKNPHFKSKYADLNNCLDAVYEAFHPHGLFITQTIIPTPAAEFIAAATGESDASPGLVIRTLVMHESGQWIASDLPMYPDMQNPQKIGGAITYGRRYGLAAITGLTQEDDDGETAAGRGPGHDYDRAPSNGHGNGHSNGHARTPGDLRMPKTGKQLFAWARGMNETYGVDVVKWLDRYAKKHNLPEMFSDWADPEVVKASDAASNAVNKELAGRVGAGEAAD